MQEPQLIINYWAILVSALAYFALGSIWYGSLFGKIWAKEMGFAEDFNPEKGSMIKAMGLTLFGCALTTYVMAHALQVWMPSVWHKGAQDGQAYQYGLMASFFTWLGYYLPLHLISVAYEGRSWKFFSINVFYHFIGLNIAAQILAHWR